MGDRMREILLEYRECIARPYDGAAYIKPALYSYYPHYAFVVTPFDKRERRFLVSRDFIHDFWIFTEIPF